MPRRKLVSVIDEDVEVSATTLSNFDNVALLSALKSLHAAVSGYEIGAGALVRCLVESHARLGLAATVLPKTAARRAGRQAPTGTEWRTIGTALTTAAAQQPCRGSYVDRWLQALRRTAGLDEVDVSILRVVLTYSCDMHLERLWDELAKGYNQPPLLCDDPRLFHLVTGRTLPQLGRALSSDGRLRSSGLLQTDDDGEIVVLPRLANLVARRIRVASDVRSLLLGQPRKATLGWSAFQHLGEQADIAARVLRRAVEGRERGINILLYGPPGTGKSEFAATLAAAIDASLYPIGETDCRGGEPTRTERLSDLRWSLRLLDNTSSVLLFDEADDLFAASPGHERRPGSRAHFHRLLEQGSTPVIWTTNDLSALGPAVARRMSICIEMRQPTALVRTRLWSEIAQEEGVDLTPRDARDLAHAIPAAPAIFRNALRCTRLAGGDSHTARLLASVVARAANGGVLPAPEQASPEGYDPTLINADCDLRVLAERLKASRGREATSLLLSGPPGSGKSAYARYLAEVMGIPVIQKRASDLLSPFLGESEGNISQAFAEARETGSMLIFDEADSLLADRRGAQRSWEVSQVNEMLTWMESHPLPFVCTTNFADKLDQACLRRFLIKATFRYLTPAQAEAAFQRFFGQTAPPGIAAMHNLTPSDFALVRRKLGYEADQTPDHAMALLARESIGKGESARPIGFRI
jgi:transitional endoplasmic reticulum ATPase